MVFKGSRKETDTFFGTLILRHTQSIILKGGILDYRDFCVAWDYSRNGQPEPLPLTVYSKRQLKESGMLVEVCGVPSVTLWT